MDGYAAGLNAAIEHTTADVTEALTRDVVAAEEATRFYRE